MHLFVVSFSHRHEGMCWRPSASPSHHILGFYSAQSCLSCRLSTGCLPVTRGSFAHRLVEWAGPSDHPHPPLQGSLLAIRSTPSLQPHPTPHTSGQEIRTGGCSGGTVFVERASSPTSPAKLERGVGSPEESRTSLLRNQRTWQEGEAGIAVPGWRLT